MESITNINVIALLTGTFVYFMLGALWFTPLFGKAYDDALGFKRPKGYKWAPIFYWMPLVSSIVTVALIAWLHTTIAPESVGGAMLLGIVVGLAGLSVSFNNAVTPNKPGPLLHGAVTGFYHLTASILAAAIVHVVS